VALCHRRWAIPALAELHTGKGAKFVTLHRRLGSSPGAMRDALDHLIELGYVQRPGGRGHPLRPEYELTAIGMPVGEACIGLSRAIERTDTADVCARKWSLPVIDTIRRNDDDARFGDLRSTLCTITDRALAQSLRLLDGASLIRREVLDAFPPTPVYALGKRSHPLAGALESFTF